MQIYDATFDTANGILYIRWWDGVDDQNISVTQFSSRADLIAQFPEYERFADGMRW